MIWVACEGKVTEPSYLTRVQRHARDDVHIEIGELGKDPAALTRAAKKARVLLRAGDIDEIWCVFDKDDHPAYAQARSDARDVGIGVAFSNPCFELWLLWHDRDHTAHIERDDVQDLCEQAGLIVDKHLADDLRLDQWQEAAARAERQRVRHVDGGSPPDENPSSTVDALVRTVFRVDPQ